ncbi:hypothetical protein JHL17_24620 [Azospirillum sp. YIM B02556]|uniref:Uncharacterized protein n=1 Tax=Azospirillum endophyticum TaxID=2800326 RepID=A0ABS1FAY5_9PROT|nr:hypothetical protein [Azospirillum endophyticum]MBK1840592.1 hypothetical protein [Azospirillum endophyticum]
MTNPLPILGSTLLGTVLLLVAEVVGLTPAEATEVRFARNLGLGSLPLSAMQDKGLVEVRAS